MSADREPAAKITEHQLRGAVESAFAPDAVPDAVAEVVARTDGVTINGSLKVGGPGCVLEQAYGVDYPGDVALYVDLKLRRLTGLTYPTIALTAPFQGRLVEVAR